MSHAADPMLSSLLSRVDAVIVDLDGTMVDTMGDFNEAINRMLRELALPAIEAQHIEHMVGKGSEHLLRSVLKHVLSLDGICKEVVKNTKPLITQRGQTIELHIADDCLINCSAMETRVLPSSGTVHFPTPHLVG